MNQSFGLGTVGALLCVLCVACGAADESGTSRNLPGGAGAGADTDDGFGNARPPSSGDDFGNTSTTGADPASMMPVPRMMVDPDMCESVGESTEPGLASVDIVWVVDGSGSMVDEAERLNMEMDNFVMDISSAGVDTHVVLIGQQDLVPANSQLAQSGNYLFIEDDVGSRNALQRIVARFGDYESFLRPFAHVHYIIVTDDESDYPGGSPDARASGFVTELDGLLDADYTIHAIASEGEVGDPPCGPTPRPAQAVIDCCALYALAFYLAPPAAGPPWNCEMYTAEVTPQLCPRALASAAAPGVTYYRLAGLTDGVTQSICQDDWTPVFGSLKDAVVESAPLPCNYEIPEPPTGMVFDRDKVNVKYTPTGMSADMVQPFGNVATAGECADSDAWYYDDAEAPTEVLLCPSLCDRVGSGEGGTVEVLFGCATVVLE